MGAKIARVLIILVVFFWVAFFGFKFLRSTAGSSDSSGIAGKILAAFGKKPAPKPVVPETPAPSEPVLPLARTLRIKSTDFNDILPVMGTVKGETEIGLAFETPGTVEKIYFREGEHVNKGDLIAQLDTKDADLKITYARNKMNSAEASYRSAQKQFEIHKKLYEAGAIIKTKMEQIELELESARYQIETAATEVEIAKKEREKCFLYASKEGVMGPRKTEEGEFFSPQDRLGWLFEIGNVFVEVGVVERDIDKVRVGQPATVYVDAFPDRAFTGTVSYIYPVVEGRSRTMTVKIKLPNETRQLIPGMFARAELKLVELKDAFIIPTSALINAGGVMYLSVIPNETIKGGTEDIQTGVISERQVSVGYFTSDYAQITKGVANGDLVVLETQGEAKDGSQVKIVGIEELSL